MLTIEFGNISSQTTFLEDIVLSSIDGNSIQNIISNDIIEIYNILGEKVMVVLSGGTMDAGFYDFNISMKGLASGMYFYRLTAIGMNGETLFNNMRKMILMR